MASFQHGETLVRRVDGIIDMLFSVAHPIPPSSDPTTTRRFVDSRCLAFFRNPDASFVFGLLIDSWSHGIACYKIPFWQGCRRLGCSWVWSGMQGPEQYFICSTTTTTTAALVLF